MRDPVENHAYRPAVGDGAMTGQIEDALTQRADLFRNLAQRHAADVEQLAERFAAALRAGGTLFFAGNGGSAADAQHIATEYVVRYARDRIPLPAVALTTDTSLLTACANDLSFEYVFSRQVEALCGPHDLLVLHSTSGTSPNLLRAASAARKRGTKVVALLGTGGGRLRDLADYSLVVPSDAVPLIQEAHMAVEHVICHLVEERLDLA